MTQITQMNLEKSVYRVLVKLLKYPAIANSNTTSELESRVQQLTVLAKALASEIETLQIELTDRDRAARVDFDNDGIDFYDEIARFEIELIKTALNKCGGNQTQAARLLRLKSTTLNAKVKHYGLNHVRSMSLQHPH